MIPPSSRLLIEVQLQPLQGHRFQPTGFPQLGAGEYLLPDGKLNLLVESPQSVANRLEAAIWDEEAKDVLPELRGLPYVRLEHPELGVITSLTESHRLGSGYLFPLLQKALAEEMGTDGKRPVERRAVAETLLRRDPCCLLHGVFLILAKPIIRVSRILSGFIEAHDVATVLTGGARLDRYDPSGPAEKGKGNILFDRTEYTAGELVAYFNLDLQAMRGYGLSEGAQGFLFDLALYKIVRFLNHGLRLRTACDLRVVSVRSDIELPVESELEKRLKKSIGKLARSGELADPPVWKLKG